VKRRGREIGEGAAGDAEDDGGQERATTRRVLWTLEPLFDEEDEEGVEEASCCGLASDRASAGGGIGVLEEMEVVFELDGRARFHANRREGGRVMRVTVWGDQVRLRQSGEVATAGLWLWFESLTMSGGARARCGLVGCADGCCRSDPRTGYASRLRRRCRRMTTVGEPQAVVRY
jgi:hypothetical protein